METTDDRARDALILRYLPLVRKVAYRMVSRFPSCVDVDDLVSIGMLGLIDAVDKFQDARSASFGGYVRIRIQGAILDELRKTDWVPRSVRDRGDRIQFVREQLARDLGREPSETEMAKTMGISEERLREMTVDSTIRNVVSLDDGIEDDHTLGDLLASEDESPQERLERSRLADLIRSGLADLTPRERMVVDLYYFRDMNFKEIGETLGVTESRISQIHTRMKEKLEIRLADLAEAA